MTVRLKDEDVRWQVIKAMLEEFPVLRVRVKKYLREKRN